MQKCLFEPAHFNPAPLEKLEEIGERAIVAGVEGYKVTVALKSLLVLLKLLANKLCLQPFAAWLTGHPQWDRGRRQWLGTKQQPGFFQMPQSIGEHRETLRIEVPARDRKLDRVRIGLTQPIKMPPERIDKPKFAIIDELGLVRNFLCCGLSRIATFAIDQWHLGFNQRNLALAFRHDDARIKPAADGPVAVPFPAVGRTK